MANPQPDKFTRLSNELLEALCRTRINGESVQMLMVIIRKTYGYHKKQEAIPTQEFINLTGINRQSIHKARGKLSKMKIITVTQKGDTQVLSYSIQKDYTKWLLLPKKVTVTQKGYPLLPKKVTNCTPKRLPLYRKKERNLKKGRFELLWEQYPNKDGKKKAAASFLASVKTDEDWENIQKALKNYKRSERVLKGYIKNGSTWFNNWEDWINKVDSQGNRGRIYVR